MSDNKGITVVGGIPHPIGGVTSFISRLASQNMIEEIVDIYPSPKKIIPATYHGRYKSVAGVLGLAFYYLLKFYRWKGRLIHFNFSSEKGLLAILFLPKFKSEFALMLHHGQLKSGKLEGLYRLALSKVDVVYAMNDEQLNFYKDLGRSKNIRLVSSYVNPNLIDLENPNPQLVNFLKSKIRLVGSGYPDSIYNHEWSIEYAEQNPTVSLALFLYGNPDGIIRLKKICKRVKNVIIFENCEQEEFNFVLANATIYLRPNQKDSFGIAVADAVEFGVKALASNVCKRYPGSYLFEVDSFESFTSSIDKLLAGDKIALEKESNVASFSYHTSDVKS